MVVSSEGCVWTPPAHLLCAALGAEPCTEEVHGRFHLRRLRSREKTADEKGWEKVPIRPLRESDLRRERAEGKRCRLGFEGE